MPLSMSTRGVHQQLLLAPQVDLFVNYDCDLQAANLFERIVRGISRVITSAPNPNAPAAGGGGGTGVQLCRTSGVTPSSPSCFHR